MGAWSLQKAMVRTRGAVVMAMATEAERRFGGCLLAAAAYGEARSLVSEATSRS